MKIGENTSRLYQVTERLEDAQGPKWGFYFVLLKERLRTGSAYEEFAYIILMSWTFVVCV
jgi:hypothetical protein